MEKEGKAIDSKEEIYLGDKKEKIIYIIVGCAFVILIVAFFFSIPKPYDSTSQLENNTVTRIIDGDTFEYYNGDIDEIVKVRLLCVDAPERGKDGYQEAKDYLEHLIMYKEIILKSSITDEDKYGRLLRYVYVNNVGTKLFVNKLILDNEYGELLIIPPEECKEMK